MGRALEWDREPVPLSPAENKHIKEELCMNGQVLIVGAGPTGLVLALSLAKQQVPFRIIDKDDGPGQQSRAMAVMPRTLEFYDQFGFADEIVKDGIKMENAHLYIDGKEKAHLRLGSFGAGISRFTSPYSYPQDEHEKFLLEKLHEYGGEVEWNTELLSFQEMEEGVKATLLRTGTKMEEHYQYICGCDGAGSAVRHQLQLNFPGGTYEQQFFVMDIKAEGDQIGSNKLAMCMQGDEFLILMPIRSTGSSRAIGIIPASLTESEEMVTSDMVVSFMESSFGIDVKEVNWFSPYKVHHRVAERFHKGRAFLVGDAGHIHSPAGGQGMNTGIGDAVNLGWKLSAVNQGRAKQELLKSYDVERREFAEQLVKTTDSVFTRMVSSDWSNRFLRKKIAPTVVPLVNHLDWVRKKMFMILSQVKIEYSSSPVSRGKAAKTQAGIRLPYTGENYEPLQAWDWQVHVYGSATPELKAFCKDRGLALSTFSYDSVMEGKGIKMAALYFVRPDGYLGYVSPHQDVQGLQEYLARWGIIPFRDALE